MKGTTSREQMKISETVQRAYAVAKKSRLKAYAPYSNYKVGAALVTKGGEIYSGCNVENASYGGAVCAERTAIVKAASEGERSFSDIVVITEATTPGFPCALCLQAMAEFFAPKTRIWVGDMKKLHAMHEFGELLPKPFGPAQLKQAK